MWYTENERKTNVKFEKKFKKYSMDDAEYENLKKEFQYISSELKKYVVFIALNDDKDEFGALSDRIRLINYERHPMKYSSIYTGTFISRPNRFIAQVETSGVTETVHVKNTGRCRELLIPGSRVILEKSDNPSRKTKYDLTAVYKENLGLVNIDSHAPNKIVKEWLESGTEIFPDITYLKPEFVFGKSRVDFYLECGERKILIEVKGCTLEKDGVGYFPDAPTDRGVKHLKELAGAVNQGYECYIAFAVTMPKVTKVLPNTEMHPEFGEAFENAVRSGVKVLVLTCDVREDMLEVSGCTETSESYK